MIVSAKVMAVGGNGYRAWSDAPVPASAEAATREEALAKLQQDIEEQMRGGVEVVPLRIRLPRTKPLWPDNELTRDLLAEIAAARAADDLAPEPWADLPGEEPAP
ncbi:MAG: hypothetical protein K2X87_22595 [Gemmataceae bacterium]|nr:hypothetical protein [Gemmataceae bacterium]